MTELIKSAIVTGASRGIGAAVAERLARDGIAVAVNFSGDPEPAHALVDKIAKAGGRAIAVKADVSDSSEVRTMFDLVESEFGGVDILVNNAGIMKLSNIADADDELFDRQIAVNLKGVFNGLREAAKRLRAALVPSLHERWQMQVTLFMPVCAARKGAMHHKSRRLKSTRSIVV